MKKISSFLTLGFLLLGASSLRAEWPTVDELTVIGKVARGSGDNCSNANVKFGFFNNTKNCNSINRLETNCNIVDDFGNGVAGYCVEEEVPATNDGRTPSPKQWKLLSKLLDIWYERVITHNSRFAARLNAYCGTNGGNAMLYNWVSSDAAACESGFCAAKFPSGSIADCKTSCDNHVAEICGSACPPFDMNNICTGGYCEGYSPTLSADCLVKCQQMQSEGCKK